MITNKFLNLFVVYFKNFFIGHKCIWKTKKDIVNIKTISIKEPIGISNIYIYIYKIRHNS